MIRFASVAALAVMVAACAREEERARPAAPEAPAAIADASPMGDANAQAEAPARPMDEVPVQRATGTGERLYQFANGCEIVVESKRAVVKSESPQCQLHHRDIALLYASGD